MDLIKGRSKSTNITNKLTVPIETSNICVMDSVIRKWFEARFCAEIFEDILFALEMLLLIE